MFFEHLIGCSHSLDSLGRYLGRSLQNTFSFIEDFGISAIFLYKIPNYYLDKIGLFTFFNFALDLSVGFLIIIVIDKSEAVSVLVYYLAIFGEVFCARKDLTSMHELFKESHFEL